MNSGGTCYDRGYDPAKPMTLLLFKSPRVWGHLQGTWGEYKEVLSALPSKPIPIMPTVTFASSWSSSIITHLAYCTPTLTPHSLSSSQRQRTPVNTGVTSQPSSVHGLYFGVKAQVLPLPQPIRSCLSLPSPHLLTCSNHNGLLTISPTKRYGPAPGPLHGLFPCLDLSAFRFNVNITWLRTKR